MLQFDKRGAIQAIDYLYKFTLAAARFIPYSKSIITHFEFKDSEAIPQKLGVISATFTAAGYLGYKTLKTIGIIPDPDANKIEITGDNASSLDEICDNICDDRIIIHRQYWAEDLKECENAIHPLRLQDECVIQFQRCTKEIETSPHYTSFNYQSCAGIFNICIDEIGKTTDTHDHTDL